MFSLFCCVVVWVGHGVWLVVTLSGVKRFAGEGQEITSCLVTGFSCDQYL